ncbi:MAG: cache domain-containing protein [Candidatus Omnitrophota bacterium]
MSKKLLINFLLLSCLPMIILGTVFYANCNKVFFAQTSQEILNLAQESSEQMKAFLERCADNARDLSQRSVSSMAFLLAEFDDDQATTIKEFRNYLVKHPYVNQIRLITPKGKEILSTLNPSLNKTKDEAANKWFIPTTLAEDIYISNSYRSPDTRTHVLTITAPVIEKREKKGFVVLDIDARAITASADKLRIKNSGFAYIINQTALIVAHPQKEKILTEALSLSDDPSYDNIISAMISSKRGYGYHKMDKTPQITFYAPFPALNWAIGITMPVNEINAGTEAIKLNILFTTGSLLLAALLASLILSKRVITNGMEKKRDK